jgi:hypothetical protein
MAQSVTHACVHRIDISSDMSATVLVGDHYHAITPALLQHDGRTPHD